MRKLFKDTLRRLAEDDDRRQAPRQSNQPGHHYGSHVIPGPHPPPPGPSGHPSVLPSSEIGVVQYATLLVPAKPSAARHANPNQQGVIAPMQELSLWDELSPLFPQSGLAPHMQGTTYCRWCEKCRRGLAYGTLSFICADCRCWVCPDCRDVHQQGAHKTYVRAELWRWGTTPQSFSETEALCVVCAPSKEVRARLQCKDCPYALCLSCAGTPAKLSTFIAGHNVKHLMQNLGSTPDIKLFVVYPPEWFVMETHRIRPCPCKQRPTTAITHCQRCHLVIEIGQHVYWCRGCYSEWGINQWLCGTCFKDEPLQGADELFQPDHKHDFIKTGIVSVPGDPDTRTESVYCLVCHSWLATEQDRGTHFHAHINRDTNIVTRRAYIEWGISPWWLKMFQQSLSKGYERVCK